MKLTARNTHRDLAYFYLGLIIAFSFSGIFLNHRRDWNPRKYTYNVREIQISPVAKADSVVNDAFIATFSKEQNIKSFWMLFPAIVRVSDFVRVVHRVSVDLTNGKGKIETYKATPVLAQMVKLHIDTSKWWIYYSDIFGLAMLTIAITGMFIQKGENSFWKRGWKLALIGIIFPLIFLFLLS